MEARISRHFSLSREEMESLLRRNVVSAGQYKFKNDAIEFRNDTYCVMPVIVDVQDIIALLRKYVDGIPSHGKITEVKISPNKVEAVCVWYEEVEL